jgi:alkanesulfonate monooxygenase SsuD/methylene tetrahydromethanopterin reductase-like flavin-dependent oxidoreductase (luciferase family)
VLGYHHPLEIVKRYGTLDLLSGGRVILGVGVGSLEAEFDLLGQDFNGRGARADDALAALRASFGHTSPTYSGPYFRYHSVVVDPAGARPDVPIWVGGRTRRSLRRAVALGDGWIPFGLGPDDLGALLGAPDVAAAVAGRGSGFDVVLAPEPPLDPLADPSGAARALRRYAGLGATGLSLRFVHQSRSHYVEQLEAMRAVADREDGADG